MFSTLPVETGTIVKIWKNNRGHDYVVAGVNRSFSKAFLIKSNCINNDGSIHAATTDVHKVLEIESDPEGTKFIPGIKRVVGKRNFAARSLARWAVNVAQRQMIRLKDEDFVLPPVGVVDAREATTIS